MADQPPEYIVNALADVGGILAAVGHSGQLQGEVDALIGRSPAWGDYIRLKVDAMINLEPVESA